jgi:uncharacterized OsmC-like protein
MRNGMNISGFSEIIQEIQQDPAQALFSYSSFARWSSHSGMLGGLNPAQIGVLRAPRCFDAPILPVPAARGAGMLAPASPAELAIVALSGCFLVSMVSGFSARRTTVDRLEMGVRAQLPSQGQRPPRVSYAIDARIDKGVQEALEVIETVKLHSPNHQTFTHALPVSVELHQGGECLFTRTLPGFAEGAGNGDAASQGSVQAVDLRCSWLYGTQLEATVSAAHGQPERRLPIDQPKQLAGLDWAPNPQEYLLMALASDVLSHFVESTDAMPPTPWEARLTAKAHVDIRGMCDVAPVPVHLQGIRLQLDVTGVPANYLSSLGELLVRSAEVSQVSHIVRHAVQFEIGLGPNP